MDVNNKVLVISESNRFSAFLSGNLISNRHFKNLKEFIDYYTKYPLTARKIVLFQSGITDLNDIKKFSEVILKETSQVEEMLFVIEREFSEYFEVTLSGFPNKKFLPLDITYSNLELIVSETGQVKRSEAELKDVVQKQRKIRNKYKLGRFETKVIINRKIKENENKESKLLREGRITKNEPDLVDEEPNFVYVPSKNILRAKTNLIFLYDSGINVYNLIKSGYFKTKYLMIDFTDGLLLSSLVEQDEELTNHVNFEKLYTVGFKNSELRKLLGNDSCIIRSTYNIKKHTKFSDFEAYVKYFIDRNREYYEYVYIIYDDLKLYWEDAINYIILPAGIEHLMKMLNFFKEEHRSMHHTFIKLDNYGRSRIPIDEETANLYIKNLKLENHIQVLEGSFDVDNPEEIKLLEIVDLDALVLQKRGIINEGIIDR